MACRRAGVTCVLAAGLAKYVCECCAVSWRPVRLSWKNQPWSKSLSLVDTMPSSDQAAGNNAVKRGRGRPPSQKPPAAKSAIFKAPRPRGRPPKAISLHKSASSGVRPRGRPREHPVDYEKVEKLALLLNPSERERLVKKLSAPLAPQKH